MTYKTRPVIGQYGDHITLHATSTCCDAVKLTNQMPLYISAHARQKHEENTLDTGNMLVCG